MKVLLWTVLAACFAANVFLGLVAPDGATRIVLSCLTGLGVLVSGAGLWFLRDRRAD
ncbi:hypothetical protein SALCHL_000646 [Streptomyces albus subsp. chlorinus]|uniref:hypothetical protein n=1 Tax=Streptomyces albus TaxID=1888 RepID=UPI0015702A05|nr:hypothetical protein [Streptomyces albus]